MPRTWRVCLPHPNVFSEPTVPARAERWIVVGAGSAGCVAARRLVDAGRDVVLVEAGPPLVSGGVPDEIDGDDSFATHSLDDRVERGLIARRVRGHDPVPYLRGRGVGGSSSINAMVALRGSMQQYLDWGWSDASSAFDRVLVPSAVARPDELGRVDRLLLAATDRAELAPLTRRDGRRVTVAEAYLWPVAGQIDIRTGTGLDRVVVDGEGAAVGVVLVDGTRIDADAVVLAAGAIHSPCILQRSGVEGSGRGLRDHPAAGLVLRLGPGRSEGAMEDASHHDHALGLATASFATFGPVQVLALNHLGRQGPADLAMLLVALMTPTGTGGTVTIATDDPTVGPRVDFDLLSTSADRTALRAGVRAVADLLTEAPFADAVTDVFVDDRGTRLAELDLDDDTSLDAWLMAHTADYVHASSSCADVVDVGATGDGSVRGCSRLFVCDASAFPDIPDANTHLPTMMLAERLAARWTGRELHTTARPSRHGRINR